jgi:hypothetical protein
MIIANIWKVNAYICVRRGLWARDEVGAAPVVYKAWWVTTLFPKPIATGDRTSDGGRPIA